MSANNKKVNRLKKYSLRFGIVFFIVLLFLTYFSATIENMLLPQVKTTDVMPGRIGEDDGNMTTKYLLPISSVIPNGENGTAFVVQIDENGKTVAKEVLVDIKNSDDFYYEVTSKDLFSDMEVIYETTKDLINGGRVNIEEEEND